MAMAAGRGLHDVVDRFADASPGAPAAEDEGGCWSYQELRAASVRAAAVLVARGLRGDAAPAWAAERPAAPRPVLLLMPRGREWYALCLAAWRLGIPVVALSDDMPDKAAERERAARAVRELRPLAAVVAGDPGQLLPGLPNDCVAWSTDHFFKEAQEEAHVHLGNGTSVVSPDSALLYCYTGGTTKHSKCLVVTHAMALWEMENYATATQSTITSRDRVLCYTSAYWGAASFGQLDIALAFGACCVFVPSETGVEFIAKAIDEYRISVLGTVPSQLRGSYPGGPEGRSPSLRVILTWGEKLPVKLSRSWKEHCHVFELLIASEYWLALWTDCSIWRDPSDGQEKHVYQSLPTLDMLLLTEDGQRLSRRAEGSVGEFLLTGPTVSPGYLGPDGHIGAGTENDSAYVRLDDKVYFRSRDRLRLVRGSGMVYCGRADSLAKKGGTWVDLEAMEEAVVALPGVSSAVVLGGDELDVFLIMEPPERHVGPMRRALEQIRRVAGSGCRLHVRSELPLHPATAKIDRRALRTQLDGVRGREADHVAYFRWLHGRMLLGYATWYLPAVLLVALPSLALWPPRQAVLVMAARLLLMPYLWAASAHVLDACSSRGDRAFFDWPLGRLDLLLFAAAFLPWCCLHIVLVASLATVAWLRDRRHWTVVVCAIGTAAWCIACGADPRIWLGGSLAARTIGAAPWCIAAVVAVLVLGYRRYTFYLSLPLCFFVLLPKWMFDEWQWRCRCDEARLRRLLRHCFDLCPQPRQWDGSWWWTDEQKNAYWAGRGSFTNVRLKSTLGGWATTLHFVADVRPALPGSVRSAAGASGGTAGGPLSSALAALVERAGGSTEALGALDSLQAITLAELVRKELGSVVSVAEVLRCPDFEQLMEKVASSRAAAASGQAALDRPREDPAGCPDGDGAYRVYTMQFKRMPVDWMVRYTGPGHLDLAALQRAADRLVARHSALRTAESPDEPLRDQMDKVAALWQLWASVCGNDGRLWRLLSAVAGGCLFQCWPRTVLRTAETARVTLRTPEDGSPRDKKWDHATDDEYIHECIREMAVHHRWPFDLFVVPLFKQVPPGTSKPKDAAEAALRLPPEAVSWYMYCGICHAYSDGASGQALMSDLLRFYSEESGVAQIEPLPPVPEQLSLLQRRLRPSLRGRTPGAAPDPNNDVFHEVICEDWGRRGGFCSRIFFDKPVLATMRAAAVDVMGCGSDIAWLTAIMGSMFRLFPEQKCIRLALKVACRDGPGELQMVGFLSEHRLLAVDILDPETSTLMDIAETIGSARRSRAWRAPMPYEAGLTVFVNIVSAMVDGLPAGFKHIVKPSGVASGFVGNGYCHLNIRIDQLSATDFDFRIFHWDDKWGWSWYLLFADALGNTIQDMATRPHETLLPRGPPPGASTAGPLAGVKRPAEEAAGEVAGEQQSWSRSSEPGAGAEGPAAEPLAGESRRRKVPRVEVP